MDYYNNSSLFIKVVRMKPQGVKCVTSILADCSQSFMFPLSSNVCSVFMKFRSFYEEMKLTDRSLCLIVASCLNVPFWGQHKKYLCVILLSPVIGNIGEYFFTAGIMYCKGFIMYLNVCDETVLKMFLENGFAKNEFSVHANA